MIGQRLFWKLGAGYLLVVLGAGLAILLLSGRPLAQFAWLLPSAAMALPVVLVLALWLARRLTRPLEDLTDAAEAMAVDESHRRLPEVSGDEVGRLARALNKLATSARERMSASHEGSMNTASSPELEAAIVRARSSADARTSA